MTAAPASYASNRFKIVFEKAVVLPVKFVALKAYTVSGNSVNVDWQTADETNTHHYEVERSHDGTNFTSINTTAAKGAAANHYSINDAQPFTDVNFYRIKGVENSGEELYSNIVKVSTAGKEVSLNVFPNPATDGITSLQLNNMPKGKYAFALINIGGQVVYSNTVENTGRSSTHMIDLGKTIPAGVYQLVVTDPDAVKYTRELVIK